jgi:hypothetical protein
MGVQAAVIASGTLRTRPEGHAGERGSVLAAREASMDRAVKEVFGDGRGDGDG